ncbi:MAG TPA: DUF6600 domain-containing protein [Thermoanaerobaculia bacterium]|nr:DUF6600 domain-containing protein [Thermoanaerobaculia bacterium]
MRARIALLTLLTATGWAAVVSAQPYYPPPPPPPNQGYGAPPPPSYDPGYNNQGYDQQGYDPQGNDQGYDDQEPYYDDQRPDAPSYDQTPGTDQGYYDEGYNEQAYNQGRADVSIFYGNLSPYGRWIQRGSYGWVWEPTHVRVGWRPYTEGRWVNTDYGWTWLSDEPWGWATYHYGRWLLDREYGWLWVPGTEWGPAWCSFQEGNGYIGWAPLPPTVGFRVGFGIQIGGLSLSAAIDPYAYSFVPERAFLRARVATVILPPARNVTFIRNTRDITRITVVNNRIVNQSLPVQRVEQVTGQRVQRYQIAETRNPAQAPRGSQIQGDRINIFRPAATLTRPQANVTPQVVIQHRQQQLRQREQVPGQPPAQGQWRRPQPPPGQPQPAEPGRQPRFGPQPGQPQPVPGQPQPQPVPGRQPRWQTRQMPSPEELNRKHQDEQQQLRSRQMEERNRIQQSQDSDTRDRQNQARAQQNQAQRQAEQKALQEQQQREQQLLQARQQREQQAAEARRNRGQQNQGQGQQQNQGRQNRQNQDQKDQKDQKDQGNNRRERRPEPPPPPPPSR